MKRYGVYKFPSYHGTPWMTNSRLLTWFYSVIRILSPGHPEIRCIDHKTDDHFRVW